MKLSYKDMLLLFGIIVAVIITLTTLVFHEEPTTPKTSETEMVPKTGLITPVGFLKRTFIRTAASSLQVVKPASSR